jgi:tripartite-type tricarboxylate transporter receptor subunit TctC
VDVCTFARAVLAITATLMLASFLPLQDARADAWPQHAVRVVTPFPSGAGGDVSGRLFAEKLSPLWGKPVVIDNQPGADGIIALTAVLGARDDHTLLYSNGGPFTSNLFSHKALPYDADRDFVPISPGAAVFIALAVPASLNVDALAAFVKLAGTQPGQFNWGATPGALDYIIPGFLRSVGLTMTRVSYSNIGPALQDLAEARIHLYVAGLATVLPIVNTGKARIVAVTNLTRSPLFPDAPTTTEARFPQLAYQPFLGFFGPRTMTADVRNRIGADIRAAGADRALTARLADLGFQAYTGSPAALMELAERERAKIAEFAPTAIGIPQR